MGLMHRPRTYHLDRPATNTERSRVWRRKRADEVCRLRRTLATKVYHQSLRHDWETPWPIFAEYDAEFHCTLDVCATSATAAS